MSSSIGGRNGPFLIIIDDLPRRYTWQDLKDLVRREAAHGIWTDMSLQPSGGGKGCARIQRFNEATNVYRYLLSETIEGRPLKLVLFDISRTPPERLASNWRPSDQAGHLREASRVAGDSGSWQAITPSASTSPNNAAYTKIPGPAYGTSVMSPTAQMSQASLVQAMSGLSVQQQQVYQQRQYEMLRAQQMNVQQQQQQQQHHHQQQPPRRGPSYVTSATGTPINSGNGLVRTESRGVFVSGLNYKTRSKEVETLFARVGEVVKCELQKDASTGKSKGKATIQYARAEDAQRAIAMINGRKFMDMTLSVRADTEATTLSPPASAASSARTNGQSMDPVIVNGSNVPQMR